MKIVKTLLLMSALAACTSGIVNAQSAGITSITHAANVITIHGINFIQPRGRFDVLLGTTPLAPASYSNDAIVAPLPASITPGSYLVALVPQPFVTDDGDTFIFTLAAAGTKGETGAQGTQGIAGPQGSVGPRGPTGITGATGATGGSGPQGQPGPAGAQGRRGFAGNAGQRAASASFFGQQIATNSGAPQILNASVNVARLPADIVAVYKASVVETDLPSAQCQATYLLSFLPPAEDPSTGPGDPPDPTNPGPPGPPQDSGETFELPERLVVAVPNVAHIFDPVANFTTHAHTHSRPAGVAGNWTVSVRAHTECAAYIESGNLTLMVLTH